MNGRPLISIMMTSRNHAPFLGEQVRSILAQTWDNWCLTISDDDSTDGSWDILKRFEAENPGRVRAVRGPCQGAFANYMSLLADADPKAGLYAWCDSDDIWLPRKLEWAAEALVPLGEGEPAVYCSQMDRFDQSGCVLGPVYPWDKIFPGFGNALVESVAAGPTLVLNRKALELMALGRGRQLTTSHDWWCYLVVIGAGGRVIFDPRPTVRYRLHGGNLCNTRPGPRGWLARLGKALKGSRQEDRRRTYAALAECDEALTPESRRQLAAMSRLNMGEGGPIHRLGLTRAAGLYRQSWAETAFLYLLAAMGRL